MIASELTVKTYGGKKITLNIDPSDTEDTKEHAQRLYLAGKPLQEKNVFPLRHNVAIFSASSWIPNYSTVASQWLSSSKRARNSYVNTMHRHSSELPLSPAEIQDLIKCTWPFVQEFYNLWNYTDPYLRGGFAVHYSPLKDKSLDLHVDDSLYTLNLCLYSESKGADVIFHTQIMSTTKKCCVSMEAGDLLIHLGSHKHETTPLIEGERVNLILWFNAKIKPTSE